MSVEGTRALDCRKHHGALFHASAIFPQDALTMYPVSRHLDYVAGVRSSASNSAFH